MRSRHSTLMTNATAIVFANVAANVSLSFVVVAPTNESEERIALIRFACSDLFHWFSHQIDLI